MKIIDFIFSIQLIALIYQRTHTSKNNETSKNIRNIQFTIFLITTYFVYVSNILEPREVVLKNPVLFNYISIVVFGLIFLMIVYYIWIFGKGMLEEKKFIELLWLLSYILLSFSFIYFTIYHYNNKAFMYMTNSKWYKIAFDFLYYAFCRGLTLGGGTLEPMSLLAKLFSMIQIIIFYFIIGKSLTNLKK